MSTLHNKGNPKNPGRDECCMLCKSDKQHHYQPVQIELLAPY